MSVTMRTDAELTGGGASTSTDTPDRNLDLLAARTGQNIVVTRMGQPDPDPGKLDNVVTKALAVLQRDGLYAGLLFLYSRSKNEQPEAKVIREHLLRALGDDELKPLGLVLPAHVPIGQWLKVSTWLTKEDGLLSDLDHLLLVKDVYEQTLIYARFSAKAEDIRRRSQPREEGQQTPSPPSVEGTAG